MSDFQIYISTFFWDFKRRDNVEYNFAIVENLIHACLSDILVEDNQRKYFFKPIIIITTSIIECILYDFLIKIQQHHYERVPKLTQKDIDSIKAIDIPYKLASYNEICKKHELLGTKSDEIYKRIKLFTNIRNRIHIQNSKGIKPLDEDNLWTASLVKSCGSLLKDICLLMRNRYPRPDKFHLEYITPRSISFPEPWGKI